MVSEQLGVLDNEEFKPSESFIKKRYNELQRKGISILDISPDTVPRLFLDALIKQSSTSFHFFFDEFVIDTNKNLLSKSLLLPAGDGYGRVYIALLLNTKDKRTLNAVMKELNQLQFCAERGVPRMPFLGIASRKRIVRSNVNSPIRVFLHVADKIDLRVGAALFDMPLWQYIGELIAEGMLRLFVQESTTPMERALLEGKIYHEVSDNLREDAMDAVYERVIHEYKAAIRSVYGISEPNLRRDFDMLALHRMAGNDVPVVELPAPADDVFVINIDNPLIKQKVSIIDNDNEFDDELLAADIRQIIDSNVERMMGKQLGLNAPIADPMIRATIDKFRDTVFDRQTTKNSKITTVWKEFRMVTRSQMETLAILNDVDLSQKDHDFLDNITKDICKTVFSNLVKNDIIDPDAEELADLDDDMVIKVRCAIDDATMEGGITKSQLRRQIGRNHTRYLPIVDEILAYLLETGKYIFDNGRYIAVTGSRYTTRMVSATPKGRPKKVEDNGEIVMNFDKLDWLPVPKKKKSKGEKNDGQELDEGIELPDEIFP